MIVIVLPAILTIIGNIIFYLWIKKRVDNSIEQYKIAYSGVFKEKIDIYREILSKIYRIKLLVNRYHIFGDKKMSADFFQYIEEFIHYYLKNQPFLSGNMIDKLSNIRAEFQDVYENSHYYHKLSTKPGLDPKEINKMNKKFIEAGNKIKNNNTFKGLEDVIIKEMRADLKTDNFEKENKEV